MKVRGKKHLQRLGEQAELKTKSGIFNILVSIIQRCRVDQVVISLPVILWA